MKRNEATQSETWTVTLYDDTCILSNDISLEPFFVHILDGSTEALVIF